MSRLQADLKVIEDEMSSREPSEIAVPDLAPLAVAVEPRRKPKAPAVAEGGE
jgi:hypothetical protein